jgi:miniconductance mechanosensitive channel
MEESGIRQVKRSIFIDMKSIRFLDKDLRDRLCRIPVLKEFIESKETRTVLPGKVSDPQDTPFFNSYQITNLGIFRFYAETYLKNHPDVDTRQTVIMRHRHFEGNGLNLQLYLFTKNNQFVPYENIQSEIVEHLLAIMNEFGLKIFQQPTGEDLQTLSIK